MVASKDIYGGAYRAFSKVFSRFGLDFTFVDPVDLAAVADGFKPNTTMLWLETPSNPKLAVTDIAGAVIKKAFELTGGGLYPFGGNYASTVYIKVADTQPIGAVLDKVYIDFLAIGGNGPVPQNSGCAAGPTQAPTLTASAASYQAVLSWTSISGAVAYWVFRTEGDGGCNLGKALIAKPSGTSYTDTAVAAGREYCYAVMAVGASGSESSRCFGGSSTCQCVTPLP